MTASCFSKKGPVPEAAPEINQTAEVNGGEPMIIKWGNAYADGASALPTDGKFAKELNDMFGVALDCNPVAYNWDDWYPKQLEERTAPDIFKAYLNVVGFEETVESGAVRAIPWNIIEAYAPRYAAFIGNNAALRGAYSSNTGDTYALMGLTKKTDMLGTYSVYRLDWLEKYGFAPPGEVSQLSENIYFTESAYTMDEFIAIMEAFSGQGEAEGIWIDVNLTGLAPFFLWTSGNDTLMGMFGANWSNVYENGEAVLSAASAAFESFLIFYESLISSGLANIEKIYAGDMAIEWVGWWNVDLNSLSFTGDLSWLQNVMNGVNNNLGNWADDRGLRDGLPTMNLLITPPEIGPSGAQRVNSNDPNVVTAVTNEHYMIGAGVSDEKLAKILEIYDALSFDPEFYVKAKFGYEGEHFTWAGEPYESFIETEDYSYDDFVGYFGVNTMDGAAGKFVYTMPDNALNRFAFSQKAKAMNLLPYKSDPNGVYAEELAALNAKYGPSTPFAIAKKYYEDVVNEGMSVTDTWGDYIKELEANGLAEYTALIRKYPVTN